MCTICNLLCKSLLILHPIYLVLKPIYMCVEFNVHWIHLIHDCMPVTTVEVLLLQAPFICNYQTSSYTIEIDDTTNPGPPVVTRRNTYTGSSRIIEEMIEGELAMNSNFTVTVTVSDENFDGNITATTKFSEYNGCSTPASMCMTLLLL